MQWAVIKAYQPCAAAPFAVVFDDRPNLVFYEDLLRRGRRDWRVEEWESDDLWETSQLRPMCPGCGHPLGVGRSSWTVCRSCHHMEPGANSTAMLRRRSSDPYRQPRIDYAQFDTD